MCIARMGGVLSWVWHPDVWLPSGWTWESLAGATSFNYPVYEDLWTYPFLLALGFIFIRYFILYPFIFRPLGRFLGVSDSRPRPPPLNAPLDAVFSHYGTRPPPDLLATAAKAGDVSVRQAERWLRQQAASSRTTDLGKFCDLAWELVYYSFYCVLGLWVLWDKAWLWDISESFANFPIHSMTNDLWWYYMVSLGYYWSMCASHFFTHRRKDATQLLVHHILTILLLVFSWICNFVRIGSLVLLVHECVDIPMQLAKMCKLAGHRHLMDPLFAVFLIIWLSTRTGLYPFWIMHTTLFRAHVIAQMFYPVYYIFNFMLLLLLFLHICWTYLILRIVVLKFTTNAIQDVRSSSDASAEEDDDDKRVAKKKR